MFSFTSNAYRHETCFDYNTKKTRGEKLLKLVYSPESCIPTTAEHAKGPLEQSYLSSVTRKGPTGIFINFEINLER